MAISKGPGTWGGEQAPDLSPAAQHTQSCSLASAKGLGAPRELAQNETEDISAEPKWRGKKGEETEKREISAGNKRQIIRILYRGHQSRK